MLMTNARNELSTRNCFVESTTLVMMMMKIILLEFHKLMEISLLKYNKLILHGKYSITNEMHWQHERSFTPLQCFRNLFLSTSLVIRSCYLFVLVSCKRKKTIEA